MLEYIKLIIAKLLKDEVHYIGGSISLPPPLTKEEEAKLNDLFWNEAEYYWEDKLNLEQFLVDIEEKIEALE